VSSVVVAERIEVGPEMGTILVAAAAA